MNVISSDPAKHLGACLHLPSESLHYNYTHYLTLGPGLVLSHTDKNNTNQSGKSLLVYRLVHLDVEE